MTLKDIELRAAYGGVSENLSELFYKPCLEQSVIYRRSTAYFTEGVYSLAATSYKKFFIDNAGEMLLVTSPFFDQDIKQRFDDYSNLFINEELHTNLLEESLLKLENSENGKQALDLVSILLNLKKLKIKIALVPSPGIHHEKVGIFEDKFGNSISFSGSVNETYSGWSLNSEEFKVFNNWDLSKRYWDTDLNSFNNLWNNRRQQVKVVDLPEAVEQNLLKVVKDNSLENLEKKIEAVNDSFDSGNRKSINKHSDKKTLMKHQEEVLQSWEENNYFGLIIHATGSGKTITGVNAIKRWFELNNIALVIVPSILLLEQWTEDIENEIDDVDIFFAGGDTPKSLWLKSLKFISSSGNSDKTVIVSTLATASSKEFREAFKWGPHILIVVDEVHRIGSEKSSKLLEDSEVGSALGLSATPERYGDELGTKKIFDYFKNVLEPEFSLQDAIEVGRLVPYEYFPEVIELNIEEQENYDYFTEKISSIFHILKEDPNNKQLQARYKNLLIQRSRILKKAEAKPELALEILKNNYREGEHWLIYCDDNSQLDIVINSVKEAGYTTMKYTSSMKGDRTQTLELFEYKSGVLVAIKCLDEGVDLPYLSNAIILASSKNPREHIQRRGRVLRKSKDKFFAKIYDAIVTPNPKRVNFENDSIMIGELERAFNFALGANNPIAKISLIELANKFNIDVNKLSGQSMEEEE